MLKNFVLDTNVLLHDPRALFQFDDNNVVLPIYVIEELDRFKKDSSELGRNARWAARQLDQFRKRGQLSGEGVPLNGDGVLRVLFADREQLKADHFQKLDSPDSKILAVAMTLRANEPDLPVIVISKDTNLRIRANALSLDAEDYEPEATTIDELYTGFREFSVPSETIDHVYEQNNLSLDELKELIEGQEDAVDEAAELPEDISADDDLAVPGTTFYPNQFFLLKAEHNPKHSAVARLAPDSSGLVPLSRRAKEQVWGIWPRNKEQRFALDLLLDERVQLVSLVGKAGTGKAQPLDAKVMTPDGWKCMGELQPGSQVMTPDGTPANVVEVFPQGEKDIYRVTFSDGSSTECCKEHLWYTHTTLNRDQNKPGSVKSLEEIMGTLRYGKQQKRNHSIPMTQPLQFADKELPLDPYLLGCLIGDGSMSVGHLSLSTSDPHVLGECAPLLQEVGCHFGLKEGYDHSICCDHAAGAPSMSFVRTDPRSGEQKEYATLKELKADGFSNSVYKAFGKEPPLYRGYHWEAVPSEKRSVHPVKNALMELGLWGCRSEAKFIPTPYSVGSIAQRTALLQGLMDTDGAIDAKGHCTFKTTSSQLAADVQELVQTLGGTASLRTHRTRYTHRGEERIGRISYRLTLCLPNDLMPFRSPRKAERVQQRTKFFPRRYIESVELVGRKQAQCILIDHPEHLYLTDDCVVTHNTLLAIAAGLQQTVEEGLYQKLLVSRPIFPLGRDIGFLPGTLEEKLLPWMQPIIDNVEFLMGISASDKKKGRGYEELMHQGMLQIEPLTYIRGRSIPNQFMIVDEAQNLTPHELKTIVTRVGEGTKIVLTGDPYQIDHPYLDAAGNGLVHTVRRFQHEGIAGHITLQKGERSDLAELAANLL